MARKRKYANPAEKQRAYRQRKARQYRNGFALQNAPDLGEKPLVEMKRPPVRYYGGKWRIAQWIMDYFPPHVTYVEPFCGAANILFRKPPSRIEVINDLNGEVVNFFDVLRSRPEDLIRAIELTPYSREEHRRAHDRNADYLERARRFYVRSRQSFGSGEGEYNTGWRYQSNNRRGSSCIDEWNMTDQLWAAAARLKMVQIECDDALKCIARFDTPDTLFYVDPPYEFSTRYSTEERYAHELSDDQHRQLAAALKEVQGMVLISGYRSELYDELYEGWHMVSKDTRTNGNHPATEYLWMSPRATSLQVLPMFKEIEVN